MTERIHHIGIAVRNIADSVKFYNASLELESSAVEEVAEQKVRVVMLKVGESRIELLEATAPESPIAGFLEKKGEGIHHIAYEVKNIEVQLARLKAAGVRLIDETPRRGAHGTKIAFIHPKSSGGVLTELVERV